MLKQAQTYSQRAQNWHELCPLPFPLTDTYVSLPHSYIYWRAWFTLPRVLMSASPPWLPRLIPLAVFPPSSHRTFAIPSSHKTADALSSREEGLQFCPRNDESEHDMISDACNSPTSPFRGNREKMQLNLFMHEYQMRKRE